MTDRRGGLALTQCQTAPKLGDRGPTCFGYIAGKECQRTGTVTAVERDLGASDHRIGRGQSPKGSKRFIQSPQAPLALHKGQSRCAVVGIGGNRTLELVGQLSGSSDSRPRRVQMNRS